MNRFTLLILALISTAMAADKWSSFDGYFRVSLEQSPMHKFDAIYTHLNYNDEDIWSTSKTHYRAPFLLYITPLEPFRLIKYYKGIDLSTLREIYALNLGIGLRDSKSFAIDQQVLLPIHRAGDMQLNFGGFLSTYFFRDGNPYWSTGLMGYAGYLFTPSIMVRAGLKHTMFDYLRREKADHDFETQYDISPNNWRMFLSVSLGSI